MTINKREYKEKECKIHTIRKQVFQMRKPVGDNVYNEGTYQGRSRIPWTF
jgi:hypothetical protein